MGLSFSPDRVRAVLDFWFSRDEDDWWKANPAFDAEIRDRFLTLWEEEREKPPLPVY